MSTSNQLSGRASKLVIGRSLVRILLGELWFPFFFLVGLCHRLINTSLSTVPILPNPRLLCSSEQASHAGLALLALAPLQTRSRPSTCRLQILCPNRKRPHTRQPKSRQNHNQRIDFQPETPFNRSKFGHQHSQDIPHLLSTQNSQN